MTAPTDGDPVVRPPHRHRRPSGRWYAAGSALALIGLVVVAIAVVSEPDTEVAAADHPALVAVTPVLSARRVPEFTSRPVASRALTQALTPIAAELTGTSCVEVRDSGANVFASRDADPVLPASNLKVLSAAAMLDLFDPDARLTTSFVTTAAPVNGTVSGDLYVVGGGDPLLTTDAYRKTFTHGAQPETDLEAVADQLAAAGITHITGSVVGDDSRYDTQRSVPSWKASYLSDRESSPLSALVVDDGSTMDPVTGGPDAASTDPTTQAASAFTRLLAARGIQVDGAPRAGTAPAGATKVLDVPSLPMRDLVGEMLDFSDNTTAELLTKELGVQRSSTGSTAAGVAAIMAWVGSTGFDTTGVHVVDGSGLSRENRATCRFLGDLLTRGGPTGPLAEALAKPGQPGTLDKRFTSADLVDKVRAKTGTLDEVTALSGWETTSAGRNVTFSIIINTGGRAINASDYGSQQNLLRSILTYPQTPAVETISPAAPTAP